MSQRGGAIGAKDKGQRDGGGRTEKTIKKEKFTGRTEELSGFVFNVTSARNADSYGKTVKEFARHIGATLKHVADVKRTM